MKLDRLGAASGSRLLATYLLASLVPLLLLVVALTGAIRLEAKSRGLAEARSEAALLAETGVEPILGAAPLHGHITVPVIDGLQRLSMPAVREGHLVRLRVRDMNSAVVFADDGDMSAGPDDEVTEALQGETVASLTRLNQDAGEKAPVGGKVVEVYLPLEKGADQHVVGVLEVYLPYAPIQADVSAGLRALTLICSGGLLLLYLVLALISASVTRRLRKQAVDNAYLATVDVLTELPNRTSFRREVADALVRDPAGVAVAVLDLEGFREINETLGHRTATRCCAWSRDALPTRSPAATAWPASPATSSPS